MSLQRIRALDISFMMKHADQMGQNGDTKHFKMSMHTQVPLE